jgi:hypothetical protein
MYPRSDARYGDDDPVQWPQPWMKSYCHHGCIPRRPPSNDPRSIMWWNPTPPFFDRSSNTLLSGMGRLCPTICAELRTAVETLLQRVKNYEADPAYGPVPYLAGYKMAMTQGVGRLENVAASYRDIVFGVAEVQRYFLETTALLDFMQIYKPRMDGTAPAATEVADTIGVFAWKIGIVQDCVTAGIPVWFIRPSSSFDDQNIHRVVTPIAPSDVLKMDDFKPKFRTIFVGESSDAAKYTAFHTYSRSYLQYPNPFIITRAVPRLGHSPNDTLPSHTPTAGPSTMESPRGSKDVVTARQRRQLHGTRSSALPCM